MKRKLKAQVTEEVEESSIDAQSLCFTRKQLRSRFSRRRRLHISPIVKLSGAKSHFTAVSEVSCDSSISSVNNQNPPDRKEFGRVVTKTYYRKNFKNEKRNCDEVVELSDNSCVESCSRGNRGLGKFEVGGGDITKSEVSSASRFSFTANGERKVKENEISVRTTQNEDVFEVPGVNKIFSEEITDSEAEKDNYVENSDVPSHSVERTSKIIRIESDCEELQLPKPGGFDFDLACSEQFSNGGVSNGGEVECEVDEHDSSSSGNLHIVSDSEFESSDYTPSFWSLASGSQFSERSIGDESSSTTFELFRQFQQQFCRSSFLLKEYDDHNSVDINELELELDDEDEESFRMLRKRERRQEYMHDYAEEYCNNTAYGELVIQQRLCMVHWIIEHATNKELQKETMFLGVNLLDRFLSKGYFKNVRNLQMAGIACLTLATRIEENQPNNCVRIKAFHVGNTIYTRYEVVAMEWVVQEVLNFQCFLPTFYNFLWFYLKAARANENVEKTAKYLALLTLMGHQQLCFWPSTVASALVILASHASCNLTGINARLKDKDLPECIKSMEWMVKYS
ncbi:hypothetical protein ACS0TY_011479 [Phlomoides rotata]